MENIKAENTGVDPDPIVNSYDIYIKPEVANGKKLCILQFPNRDDKEGYNIEQNCKPIALRVKPESGLFELDVPIDYTVPTYDKEKGVRWGDALKQAESTKGGTTYGLPGGFGIGAQPGGGAGRGRGRGIKDEPEDLSGMSREKWGKMLREQRVMSKQTLGGQIIPVDSCSPTYYIGAFRKNQLHLSPVSDVIQLRPQFHHIDARTDMEKATKPRDPAAGPPAAAKAIHMTAKSTADGQETHVDTMIDRMKKAQEEVWKTLQYNDDLAEISWENYEKLFVPTEGVTGVTNLKSSMTNGEYLDAISAPRDMSKLKQSKAKKVKAKGSRKGKEKEVVDLDDNGSITLSDDDDDVVMGGTATGT